MESLGDILRRLTQRDTFASSQDTEASQDQPEGIACHICGDKGWVTPNAPVSHPNFGKVAPCQCQHQRLQEERKARLLRFSNLDQLSRFTFDTLSPEGRSESPEDRRLYEPAYSAAKDFVAEPKGWLVLSGPTGAGKTHLAAAIGHRLLSDERSVFYVFVPDLLDHLRSTYGPSSEVSYDDLFEQVRNASVLILDDLGVQSATPWAQEKLYQILNHRFNLEMPTVITTEKALSDMDEPLWRRLSDTRLSAIYELERRSGSVDLTPGAVEPAMLERMTFGSFDVRGNKADMQGRETLEAALQAAKNFARSPEGWLTLTGVTGCGKTHLAVAMANQWLKYRRSVVFAFVPRLLDHLRSAYGPSSEVSYDDLFEQIKSAPILVLDDLGAERSTPWAEEKLYQIIVHRHDGRLPTVVTSRDVFFKDTPYTEPIVSRLKDPTVGMVISIAAPDYRDQKRRPERPRR